MKSGCRTRRPFKKADDLCRVSQEYKTSIGCPDVLIPQLTAKAAIEHYFIITSLGRVF